MDGNIIPREILGDDGDANPRKRKRVSKPIEQYPNLLLLTAAGQAYVMAVRKLKEANERKKSLAKRVGIVKKRIMETMLKQNTQILNRVAVPNPQTNALEVHSLQIVSAEAKKKWDEDSLVEAYMIRFKWPEHAAREVYAFEHNAPKTETHKLAILKNEVNIAQAEYPPPPQQK